MNEDFHAFQLAFFFPVLVVQGTILEVRSDGQRIDLVATDRVAYHHAAIVGKADSRCHIDVVTERYFPTLLSQIESDMALVAGRLRGRCQELWGRAFDRKRAFAESKQLPLFTPPALGKQSP